MAAPAASRETPLSQAAAIILEPLVSRLLRRFPRSETIDEKRVHDLRVAAKRLREGLRFFAPALGKKTATRHLAWIEELNDALGDVRNLDVLIATLHRQERRPGAPVSLHDLLARLRRHRNGARSALASLLHRQREKKLAQKLEARLKRLAQRRAKKPRLGPFATGEILVRLEAVIAAWEKVRLAATPESLHRARIRNKKLRYALEPFLDFLPPVARTAAASARELHDALGEMHDEDELLRIVDTALCCATAADRPAWHRLAHDAEQRRRAHLDEALQIADGLLAGGWSSLRDALAAAD